MPRSRTWTASPTWPPESAAISMSRCSLRQRPARLMRQRRLHELNRILACPFGWARQRADLAASRIDEQRCRHADGAADKLEVLEHLGVGVGVVGERLDA